MEKKKRTIFFWSLVIIFFIITPAIILYAKGYRFDLQRGVVVHSGTISIKANPQDINISLDGKISESKSLNRVNGSYNVPGLMPGSYDLSISADGYQSWNKKIEVHSGLASEIWNVILARNDYTKTDYNTEAIEKFFVSPKSKYIIYTQNSGDNLTTNILDIKNKTIANSFTFPGWKFIPDEKRENIEWSPNEDYVSVPVRKTVTTENTDSITKKVSAAETTQYAYSILDPAQKTSFNLNDLLQNNDINYVRWDPQDKNYLFYLSENSLYRTNINNITDTITIAQDVSSFDLSKNNIFYSVRPHELVYRKNLDGSGDPIQITSDFPEDITQNFRLIVYDNARIALLTQNKSLYVFNSGEFDSYYRKLGSDIEGLQFSDDGKKLLYWTNNSMSVYYLRNWNVQPTRTENSIEDITRYSEGIKNIQWTKDYEHVIFSVGAQMKVIELDPRDHRNCMDLPKTTSDTPIIVDNHAQERLYFIDTKNSSTSLYSIVFPEPTPIFGIYTPAN